MNNHTPDIEGIVDEWVNGRAHTALLLVLPQDIHMEYTRRLMEHFDGALQSQADLYEREKGEAVKETFNHFSWCRECGEGPACGEAREIAQKYGVDLSE